MTDDLIEIQIASNVGWRNGNERERHPYLDEKERNPISNSVPVIRSPLVFAPAHAVNGQGECSDGMIDFCCCCYSLYVSETDTLVFAE